MQRAGRRMRRILAGIVAILIVALSGACAGTSSASSPMQPAGPTISVGVMGDQPGLSAWHEGTYAGFDVDVAVYVAKELGYARKQIDFVSMTPATVSGMLDSGAIDMAVSTLPLDEHSRQDVRFSGPYLLARQDLLIRKRDTGSIGGPQSLGGKRVCTAKGSGAADNLAALAADVNVEQRYNYSQCVTALLIGEVDAVSADDAVLAGLATGGRAGLYLSVVGKPFASAPYGVRVRADEGELSDKITTALHNMVNDGSWQRSIESMHEVTGYTTDRSTNPPSMRSHGA